MAPQGPWSVALLRLWFQISCLQNCDRTRFSAFSHQVCGHGYGSPRKLRKVKTNGWPRLVGWRWGQGPWRHEGTTARRGTARPVQSARGEGQGHTGQQIWTEREKCDGSGSVCRERPRKRTCQERLRDLEDS